jgi:hypothetical protein
MLINHSITVRDRATGVHSIHLVTIRRKYSPPAPSLRAAFPRAPVPVLQEPPQGREAGNHHHDLHWQAADQSRAGHRLTSYEGTVRHGELRAGYHGGQLEAAVVDGTRSGEVRNAWEHSAPPWERGLEEYYKRSCKEG